MAEKTNILIIGAGKGGTALIEVFNNAEMINIACVVDVDQNSPGMQLAKKLGIQTYTDYRECLEKHKQIDEIVNVTGSEKIQEELLKIKPSGAEVVGGHSAKIMWRLVEEYRKAEEEKVKYAVEEWDRTFNTVSDFVFILDKENRILKANKAFLDVLKAKPEDVIGKHCYEILHKSDTPWPRCPHVKTMQDTKAHTEEVDDPNIGVPLLVTTSPVFDKDGNLTGSVHIAKDISEMKKAENELKKKMRDLEIFNKVAVGRELKMAQLKKKIGELEEKLAEKG